MSSKAQQQAAAARRAVVKTTLIGILCIACLVSAFQLGKLYNEQSVGGSMRAAGAQEAAPRQLWSAALTTNNAAPHDPRTTPYYRAGATRINGPVSKKPICLNTCPKARDGVCDDGRPKPGTPEDGKSRRVFCDLGTDCDDCGAWTPSGHTPWTSGGSPGPIAQLLSNEVEVFVRRSTTEPAFYLAYTDPKKDVDVSSHMDNSGMVEAGITTIFQKIFSGRCKPAQPGGKPALFVDVGGNFGWFSLLAASMGCRVIAFEPVPTFHAFFEYSVHLNGLAKVVDMRNNVISHVSGATLKMVVPSHGIWGTAGIDGLNIDRAITKSVNKEIHVPSQKLDDLIHDDVLLLKVDVEGWEWSVMQGAAKFMKEHSVENIIMEYSPGVPERAAQKRELKATVQMLLNMVDGGFRIAHIGDAGKHIQAGTSAPLPPMEEVSRHNLLYDLVDAELMSRGRLGCPEIKELKNYTLWRSCGSLPEDANPRSLRSILGHNTNIWAARGESAKLQNLKSTVGILPLNAPATQFFVNYDKDIVWGQGSRACRDLPAEVAVRHRCLCAPAKKDVCGAEEALVMQLADEGKIPNNYLLNADGTLAKGTGGVAEVMKELGNAAAISTPFLPGAMVVQEQPAATTTTTSQRKLL